MAKLYALDLGDWPENQWQALLPILSPDRQQKVLSCSKPADRNRSAGAGWLLQYAMAQEGIRPDAALVRSPLGKPEFSEHPQMQFSLSHAGPWAVCAVSRDPVGVDVELPRCTMAIARRFFSPRELEGLEDFSEPERRDRLNRLWAAKEAFVKALGGGLTIVLSSFTVSLHEHDIQLEQALSPLPYRLHEYLLSPGRICLCTTEPKPELQLLNKQVF